MYHRVREAKYREEIVTFVWDFSDHVNPGDTIVGATTGVQVSSGTDNFTEEMLVGPPVISEGTIVSQRIRRGIPGTIYTISINIGTADTERFEDYSYLAILPLPPLTFNFFLETMLYPIEMPFESLETSVELIGGYLFPSVIMTTEGITSEITLVSGILNGTAISYAMTILDNLGPNGHEALQSAITLIDGTLFGAPMYYDMTSEGIQASIDLIDGTLFGAPLDYSLTTEGLNSYITLFNGILA